MSKSQTNANPVRPSNFQAIHLVLSEWEDGERSRFLELIEDLEPEVPGLGGLMAKAVSERVFESLAIAASIYTKNVPQADVRHVLYVLCEHFEIEPHFELQQAKKTKKK
ncbi:MAG: hypothetical protein WCS85_03615 [Candidatus Peribacteraceae bacterium]|jgi:hypothetical protein